LYSFFLRLLRFRFFLPSSSSDISSSSIGFLLKSFFGRPHEAPPEAQFILPRLQDAAAGRSISSSSRAFFFDVQRVSFSSSLCFLSFTFGRFAPAVSFLSGFFLLFSSLIFQFSEDLSDEASELENFSFFLHFH